MEIIMKITFYGLVQNHSGCDSIVVEHAETLNRLIDELGDRLGVHFKEYLLGDDTCFFLINGKSIMRTGGLNTPLDPDDNIEVLPVVEAG
jgi:molybdopterin converting factor small subunit